MKKLILMTSALTLIGGAAAAEISFGAEATVTYGNWDTSNGPVVFEFGTSLSADFEETTAGGVTYGAMLTIEDLDSVEQGIIYFSGGFGKFSFGVDEFDEIEDAAGDDAGDMKYEYSMGAVSAAIVADADLGANGTTDWDLVLGYDGGSFRLGLESDSSELTEVSAEVDVANFTLGAAVDTDENWDVSVASSFGDVNAKVTYDSDEVAGIELDGDMGDVSWALSWNTDEETEASLKAAFGDFGVEVAHDSTNAGGFGDDAESILTLTYAAGDMLTFHAMVNDQEEYEVGATAGFEF